MFCEVSFHGGQNAFLIEACRPGCLVLLHVMPTIKFWRRTPPPETAFIDQPPRPTSFCERSILSSMKTEFTNHYSIAQSTTISYSHTKALISKATMTSLNLLSKCEISNFAPLILLLLLTLSHQTSTRSSCARRGPPYTKVDPLCSLNFLISKHVIKTTVDWFLLKT